MSAIDPGLTRDTEDWEVLLALHKRREPWDGSGDLTKAGRSDRRAPRFNVGGLLLAGGDYPLTTRNVKEMRNAHESPAPTPRTRRPAPRPGPEARHRGRGTANQAKLVLVMADSAIPDGLAHRSYFVQIDIHSTQCLHSILSDFRAIIIQRLLEGFNRHRIAQPSKYLCSPGAHSFVSAVQCVDQ